MLCRSYLKAFFLNMPTDVFDTVTEGVPRQQRCLRICPLPSSPWRRAPLQNTTATAVECCYGTTAAIAKAAAVAAVLMTYEITLERFWAWGWMDGPVERLLASYRYRSEFYVRSALVKHFFKSAATSRANLNLSGVRARACVRFVSLKDCSLRNCCFL